MDKGRPPLYDNPEELIKNAEAYFAKCVEEERAITSSGLALALGFSSRSSLFEYKQKEGFSVPVKKALLRIEQSYEEKLSSGACTGSIFALKNFGWKDTQTIKDETENKPETVTINWISSDG